MSPLGISASSYDHRRSDGARVSPPPSRSIIISFFSLVSAPLKEQVNNGKENLENPKIDKISNESEELRNKKRELESCVRRFENELETVSSTNSELSIRIIEKEQQ